MDKAIIKEALEEVIPAHIETAVKAELEPITKKLSDVEDQMTELAKSAKFGGSSEDSKEAFEKKAKEVFVKSTIAVFKAGIREEGPAYEIFQSEAKAAFQNEGIATEGLEFVFDNFDKNVLMWMKNYPIVDEVGVINIKGNTIKLPTWVNATTAAWVGEGATITKSKGTTGRLSYSVKKLASLVSITEEMLEDNMTTEDLYNLIVQSVGNTQASIIENGIINGESTNMEGIFTNVNVAVVTVATGNTALRTASATAVDNALMDLDAAIPDEYVGSVNNAVAMMSKYTLAQLRKMKTTTGAYMYPELRDANPKLMGKYRILTSVKMPVQSQAQDVASAKQILVGNLKELYRIVRSRGFTVTRGYATGDFEADLQSIKATQRITGGVLAGQGFAYYANSAT